MTAEANLGTEPHLDFRRPLPSRLRRYLPRLGGICLRFGVRSSTDPRFFRRQFSYNVFSVL